MKNDELLNYYDYLTRLAMSKCDTQQDAEDLVSETLLAAYGYLYRGNIIMYPKTWLANTLMHKYNAALRRKYKTPVIVNLDTLVDIADEAEEYAEFFKTNEAANVRRELIYLGKINREVLIRYYFTGESVGNIAAAMKIPEGTVKSRLSAGRNQIKKGLEQMEEKTNYLPGRLDVSNSGSAGPKNEPRSLIERDLIAQNLLILAYEAPMEITDLAKAIGIPTVYIEPIVERLVNGELMIKTESGKVYTDFIIYKPEDSISRFDAQLQFVRDRFDIFWNVMSEIITRTDALDYSRSLNPRQLKKLERYAIMLALQNFQLQGIGEIYKETPPIPTRKDGGKWIAMGHVFQAGYNYDKYDAVNEYTVWGGHRTSGSECDKFEVKYLKLCEFDTSLYDSPRRFTACGFENYFSVNGIIDFLWCVYKDINPKEIGIKNALIENIPGLQKVGLLANEDSKLIVDIPVMNKSVYSEIVKIVKAARERLIAEIGGDYRDFLRSAAIKIPPHLKSVPEIYKYSPATEFIVMAAVREAYERKLHLHDIDYCCPPVVLVYEE